MGLFVDIPAGVCKGLSARAHAGRQWPEIGFRDQFAHRLALMLGINLKQRWPLPEERKWVERCQWFDSCCRDFLQRHPQAICIELGAGLSTRFHRLSATADWPRFQWVDVDSPQITGSKARVLPHIDNYTLIGADIVVDDWLGISGRVKGQPLLIVMEGVANEIGSQATLHIVQRLCQQVGSDAEFEVVLDDRHPRDGWLFIKRIVAALITRSALPTTCCVPTLEFMGCTVLHKKDLLCGAALGMVINYHSKESL